MANQKQEQEQESFRVQRAPSAPVQQGDAEPQRVDLVGVLADEFGIARSVALRDMRMGSMTIDGRDLFEFGGSGRPDFLVPRKWVEGKTIEVVGGETQRTYRFQIQ
jgi:hypothetical protein